MKHIAQLTGIAVLFVLGSCGQAESPQPAAEPATPDHVAAAAAIIAEVEAWTIENDIMIRARRGLPITKLPDLSLEGTEKLAAYAADVLSRIEAIDLEAIEHRDRLTLQLVQNAFGNFVVAKDQYWYTFAITPYSGLFSLYMVNNVLPGLPLATDEDRAAYLGLVDDFAAIVANLKTKTEGQADRGIYLPKPALQGARLGMQGAKAGISAILTPAPERLGDADEATKEAFYAALNERIKGQIEPGFDAVLAFVDDDYEANAPDSVGMSQYPGGEAAYRRAVKSSISHDVPPEELHQRGVQKLEELEEKMTEIRRELGFEGTKQEFHDMLRTHPRFIADEPADVEERYMSYIDRIEPLVGDYFSLLPEAPYGVQRLDPAAEPGQTFGYYQMPSATEEKGLYRYNGSHLSERPMVWAQGLIYHELIPGHHFQMALHTEMDGLPVMSQSFYFMIGAYTEGWAEYASALGMEMELYDDPYDLYGRYLMEAFLANRFVVDTGMNLLGWSLEDARAFMAENTFTSPTEVATETLRYSTDIPSQALGYRFGSDFIWELRKRKEAELGDAFDIRDFHAAVLGYGPLPMWVLEQHVDWYFENVAGK